MLRGANKPVLVSGVTGDLPTVLSESDAGSLWSYEQENGVPASETVKIVCSGDNNTDRKTLLISSENVSGMSKSLLSSKESS